MSVLQLLQTLLESDDGTVTDQLSEGLRWDVFLCNMTDLYHELGLSDPQRATPSGLIAGFRVQWEQEELLHIANPLTILTEDAFEYDDRVLHRLRKELIKGYHVIAAIRNIEKQRKVTEEQIIYDWEISIRNRTAGESWDYWGRCNRLIDLPVKEDELSLYSKSRRNAMTRYCIETSRSVEIQRKGRLEKVFFPVTQAGQRFINDEARANEACQLLYNNLKDTAEMTVQSLLLTYKQVGFPLQN